MSSQQPEEDTIYEDAGKQNSSVTPQCSQEIRCSFQSNWNRFYVETKTGVQSTGWSRSGRTIVQEIVHIIGFNKRSN